VDRPSAQKIYKHHAATQDSWTRPPDPKRCIEVSSWHRTGPSNPGPPDWTKPWSGRSRDSIAIMAEHPDPAPRCSGPRPSFGCGRGWDATNGHVDRVSTAPDRRGGVSTSSICVRVEPLPAKRSGTHPPGRTTTRPALLRVGSGLLEISSGDEPEAGNFPRRPMELLGGRTVSGGGGGRRGQPVRGSPAHRAPARPRTIRPGTRSRQQ